MSEESHTQATGEALLARFTLAFARLKNAKKITPVIQAITPGLRLKVEYMKKKARLAHRQEGKAFLVNKKNKTCFEHNERDCVW